MAGFSNSKADVDFLKSKYTNLKASGEKLMSPDFVMTFKGYPNISVLVRSSQFGELTREDVEDYGPNGLKFNQHGVLRNSGEMQVGCVETIEGDVFKLVRDLVKNKTYVDITIAAASESKSGDSNGIERTYFDCKVYSDAIDLSTEDVTAMVRPSLRIVYNFFSLD